ncbi:Uncharacterized protein dnm_095950 [Desulfonema magnum]|uniref:Uncharacterized protein n=1 Tax=Desulfonema magnum TaxID=45655 RepID=A0A975GTV2_9BACT|nr:Uncharacterized protein dnm_095950 [Desulfonema magnum]
MPGFYFDEKHVSIFHFFWPPNLMIHSVFPASFCPAKITQKHF